MGIREFLAWALFAVTAFLFVVFAIGSCEQPVCFNVAAALVQVWDEVKKNPAAISALAASVGVMVAVYFHGRNLAATRLSNSAKMVNDAVARFDSQTMRRHRKGFSGKLKTDQADVDLSKAETPVLDFFEDLGLQTRRGILDAEMVWVAFSWWIIGYYNAVTRPQDLIKKYREGSKSVDMYREFEWLHDQCIDKWRSEREPGLPARGDSDAFLNEESSLAEDKTT
jgi:hypothetical protein